MKKNKLLAVLLALAMTLSLLPTAALADETQDSTPDALTLDGGDQSATTAVTVGTGKTYTSLGEAITAINKMTGEVTVEIYGKVEYTAETPDLTGAYNTINFVGMDSDAEISITRNGSNGYISGSNQSNDCAVTFKNLKLSKSADSFANDAGFMNVAFTVYRVGSVAYTNCTFTNGACAAGCPTTYTSCTFQKSFDKYPLWAYGSNNIVVEDCTFNDNRGIKMYDENKGQNNTTVLTVTNSDFSKLTDKPAIVLTLGKSVTLSGNTYSDTGVFELEVDDSSNGTIVDGSDLNEISCASDAGACGVLVTSDGTARIYRTLPAAISAAADGATVKLLSDVTVASDSESAAENQDPALAITKAITLDGDGHTIQAGTFKMFTKNGVDKPGNSILDVQGVSGQVTIKDLTIQGNNTSKHCLNVYESNVALNNVTLKDTAGRGLIVNASNVTATGKLELDNNGWGDDINVGWGNGIAQTEGGCTFNAGEATLVGVDMVYADKDDVTRAGGVGKFHITLPASYCCAASGESGILWAPVVATNGDNKYASIQAAISEADTVTLLADAEFDWGNNSYENSGALVLSGKTIVGATGEETITFKGYGSANPIKNLTLNNLKVKDLTVGDNEGAWEHGYLEFDGLKATDVVFLDQPQFNGTCALTNCTFTGTKDQYAAWINSGNITFIGCEFNGARSLKIHEAYGSDVESVTVDRCTFKTTAKPGVVIGTLDEPTTVRIKNSTFTDCPAGDQSKHIYESDTVVSSFHFLECGNTVTVEGTTIPSQEHIWDAGVVTTQPTYSAPGVRTYTCAECGTTKTETIAQLVDSGSSGGGGGGSSTTTPSQPTTSTETKPDGSTTTTETKPDGTVTESNTSKPTTDASGNTSQTTTETSTGKDGVTESKTETVTKPDGSASSTTESTTTKPDGTKTESTTETTINKDGSTASTTTETTTNKDGTVTESKTEATTSTVTNKDGSTTETKQETTTTSTGSKTESTTVTTVNKDGSTTATTTATTTDKAGTVTASKTESTTNKNGTTTEKTTTTETKANGTVTESKTETTINKDGSSKATTTETVTKADGTKVESKTTATTSLSTNKTTGTVTETKKETTTSSDGVKSEGTTVTQIQKDGTVTSKETVKASDSTGTTATKTTTLDAKGQVTTKAEAAVSTKAVTEAAKTGVAVTIPVEVAATKSTSTAPTVSVSVPKAAESVKVELPVQNVTPGTVAVIVNADGTEKIVSTSMVTENGVALKLDGSATVKLVDNSKSFTDVPETNVFYNEIASLSAREIMIGKTGDKFDLHNSVTLDQIANVAGRITGAVDVKDFNAGVAWGKDGGLKTGNVSATRGDVLKALYIAAGSPAVEDTSILAKFKDASGIPADMAAIAAWAAQNGILKGNVDGSAGLGNNVTRGQACALAGRTMGTLA